jgi:hypothetical protein
VVSTSDLLHFNKASVPGEGVDGVWTAQNTKGQDDDGKDCTRQRAPSVASSAVTTGTTGTAWDNIKPGRVEQGYRSRIGSSQPTLTPSAPKQGGNWAKQGAAKPDRGALREAEKQREALRKVQEQERARFEEDESSDSEWEL